MKIVYGKRFIKSAKRLPLRVQDKLDSLLEIVSNNPFQHRLHTKHLTGKLSGLYSFRITRDWRVVFQFLSSEVIKLIDVDHRRLPVLNHFFLIFIPNLCLSRF